jgi:phospholipase/carboxylesterase
MNESYEINIDGWLFRIQPPPDPAYRRVLVAIHGWTGNQYSMDIFTQKLRNQYWVIFPCAPYPAEGSGFSWIKKGEANQKDLYSLMIAAQNLHSRIDSILHDHLTIDPGQINLMGFSQGSAISLLYSLNYSSEWTKIALLSGFLPEGLSIVPSSLKNRSYFIAHGKKDAIIPVEQAHKLASFIEDSGGNLDFCEADTGHKLGKDCFIRVQEFLLA